MAALDRIWGVIGPAGLRWFLHGQPGWDGVVQDGLRKVAEQGATLSALDYVDALNSVVRMRTAFIDIFDRTMRSSRPALQPFRGPLMLRIRRR